jgi:hypothetical protein
VQGSPQQNAYNLYVQQANNNVQQQWPSRPQSVQPNMPSPSSSVRSTRTAPVQRPPYRSGCYPGNEVPIGDRNNTSLLGIDELALPGQVSQSTWNSLDPSYHQEAWGPLNLRNSNTSEVRNSLNPKNGSHRTYRIGPGSIGSVAPVSDSGFFSNSAVSYDAGRMDHSGVSHNLTQQIGHMNIQPTTSEAPRLRRMHSDQRSQVSRISGRSGIDDESLKCLECPKISKCRSDHKYVSSDAVTRAC